MANLILQQKISRMMLMSYGRVANFRKPEKFTVGAQIQKSEIRMLQLTIKANRERSQKRKIFQQEIDVELALLRALIDQAVSPEAKIISPGLHKVWSEELSEIGRLLGGWIKGEAEN